MEVSSLLSVLLKIEKYKAGSCFKGILAFLD